MTDIISMTPTLSTEVGYFSDASVGEDLGFGVILGKRWIKGTWLPAFIKKEKPSIEFLEFFALVVGIVAWGDSLRDGHFCLHCDNQAVVKWSIT